MSFQIRLFPPAEDAEDGVAWFTSLVSPKDTFPIYLTSWWINVIRVTSKNSYPENSDIVLLISHCTLRKHAYSNILKTLPPKNENFQMKNSDIFPFSAQNIDCGYSLKPPRRGGSNEYPQSMFLSRNKKNNVYPCKPQFYCNKWGLRGSKLYMHVFVMSSNALKIIWRGPRYFL